MPHIRSLVRHKVKDLIKNKGLVDVKEIFASKVMNLTFEHHVPGIQVYFDDGTVDLKFLAGSEENDAILQVEILANDANNVDDRLDEISAVIEPLLKGNSKLDGLVEQLTLKGFGYTRDDKTSLASLTLTYRVKFQQ